MSAATVVMPVRETSLLKPILIGGAIAGTLDLTSAFITFGANVPRAVAAGLLGAQARHSTGPGIWLLGVFLHYFIAFSAAAVYCASSRKLEFLKPHWLVCGLLFGVAMHQVMNLVVMPLCAFHFAGPYTWNSMVQGLAAHMLLIGLPIAFSLRRWSDS